MKFTITLILTLVSTFLLGQTLPELVEKGFTTEFSGKTSKFSKVDFNQINQLKINKLISRKIRTNQIINNPLTIITGGKQKINESAVKSAKHHTIYQAKRKRLTHTENEAEFKTFSHRYKFYSNGDFGSIITKGEICTNIHVKKNISYNKLVRMIIKSYMGSKPHKKIILENYDKGEFLGAYVIINKNGSVYNTIVFP
jgi:hypothetical protein